MASMENGSKSAGVPCVLLLCPTKWDIQVSSLLKVLPKETRQRYNIQVIQPESTKYDLLQFTKQCEETIKTRNISMVLSFSDIACLVHAALSETFSHIRGPTVESVFLTHHKFSSRKYLDPDAATVKHMLVDKDDMDNVEMMKKAQELIQSKGGFLKPVIGHGGNGTWKINKMEEFLSHIKTSQLPSVEQSEYFEEFLNVWIADKHSQYDLKLDRLLLEEFVDINHQVVVHGLVLNGEIHHWSIQHTVRSKDYPQCFLGTAIPADLTQSQERALYKIYDEMATRLVDKGFNDQVLNIEFFVYNSQVRVIEVNGRVDNSVTCVLANCYNNGDQIAALLKQETDGHIPTPQLRGIKGMCGYITTFQSGRIDNILDFSEVERLGDDIVSVHQPGDDITVESGDRGTMIAWCYVYGQNREELMSRYFAICRKVLKKPEYSPLR
ncbi:uncharacterized protein LOC144452981 [Glandiceps talaboti]